MNAMMHGHLPVSYSTNFEIPFARTDHYQFSYYPKSIRDWNNLPTDTTESQSLQLLLDKL